MICYKCGSSTKDGEIRCSCCDALLRTDIKEKRGYSGNKKYYWASVAMFILLILLIFCPWIKYHAVNEQKTRTVFTTDGDKVFVNFEVVEEQKEIDGTYSLLSLCKEIVKEVVDDSSNSDGNLSLGVSTIIDILFLIVSVIYYCGLLYMLIILTIKKEKRKPKKNLIYG